MIRKLSLFLVTSLLVYSVAQSQSLKEGIKYLQYEKNNSAAEVLKKYYESNPKNPEAIYWYGQSFLALNDIKGAKEVYQKALQDGINSEWVIVGASHVEMAEGGDINSIKQKWEQAITMSKALKGKNKGKPNPLILNAIGHANAEPNVITKDIPYAIDKLKEAAELDLTTPDILINLGINYLKSGPDAGGDAVKSFQEAITRDPKNALANYRIGCIYYTQNNKESFETYFNAAIQADPEFPLAYYKFYDYYSQKEVNKAKDYLDQYISKADKDPKNDFYLAEYLFRAGHYQESLDKAKSLENSAEKGVLPRLDMLFAYDYDRLADSASAKSYLEKFFSTTDVSKTIASDYEIATKVFSKFAGSEQQLVGYLEKIIAYDTTTTHKIAYITQVTEIWAKAKNYTEQYKWLKQLYDLKKDFTNRDFYFLTDAAIRSKNYAEGLTYSDAYIQKFPDQIYGYKSKVQCAIPLDADTSTGSAIPAVQQYIDFLKKDPEKYKKTLPYQYYYQATFFADKAKDLPKALAVVNDLLSVFPQDEFGQKVKPILEKAIEKTTKTTDNQKNTPTKANQTKQKN